MRTRGKSGNRDEREKTRKLTADEERRLRDFETVSEELASRGYVRSDLTVSIVGANVFGVILLIPLLIGGMVLFLLRNRGGMSGLTLTGMIVFLGLIFLLTALHELIHGACWAIFAEGHWKDISFGFMKQYLTPYCACSRPLGRGPYIFGALMPMVLLGIIPLVAGILSGSFWVMMTGIVMTDAAAGDILIVVNLLRYRSSAASVIYMDHPTQAGGVIFEK